MTLPWRQGSAEWMAGYLALSAFCTALREAREIDAEDQIRWETMLALVLR